MPNDKLSTLTVGNTTYDIKDADAARKGMYVGTCPSSASVGGSTVTMASSADKVVTVDTFPTDANNKPLVGTIIGVKYATSNTYKTDTENNKPEAAHRINVNDTGYIQIYYNNAALKSGTSANTLAAGYKNRYIFYQYDGTYWVWLSAGTDTNTTYAGYSFGLGLGVQNNASASATITVTLSNYALGTGGVTSVRFLYDVPANATMNINSKGAKSIYYKNSAITAGIIKAGDTATFVYSGQYHLIAIDRWDDDIKAKAPFIVELTATETNEQISVSTTTTFAQIKAAHDAGRIVIARVAGQTDFVLTTMINDEATFSVATTQAYSSLHYLATLKCTNQDVWTVITSPFADVAFSGSYNDLSNKPTIPDISNKADKALVVELTRVLSNPNDQESFTGTFTSNKTYTQITDAIGAGIEVYANDNGAIYSLSEISEDYVQFTRVIGVDQAICRVTIDAQQITQGVTYAIYREWGFVYYADLATVATSGSYNDLTNKPTIPAAVTVDSSLTGSSQTNPVQGGAIYSALAGKEDRQKFVIDLEGTPPTDAEIIAALHDPKKDVTLIRDYGDDLIVELRHYSTMPDGDGYYHYFCCLDSINNIYYSFVYYEEDGSINQDDAFSTTIPLSASDIGADVFVVTITASTNNGTTTYSADKTNAQIYAAWQAGRTLICTCNGYYFPLNEIDQTYCAFTGLTDDHAQEHYIIQTVQSVQSVYHTVTDFQLQLVSGTNIKTINNTSLLGSGDLTPLYAGSIAGKLYRNNVGGTGNFSISGNSGCIPNIPAGTYVVSIFAKSTTTSYTYRFNFGSVTYDLSTTNGVIYDTRTITLSAAGTFSGSVYNSTVASNSILSVVMYNWQMPVTSVGMAAVTNSYQDLNDKPTIPTVNNGTLTIQRNGTNVQTFTANQSSNATANIECAEPLTVVTNSNTGSVSQAMDAGKFYKFTGAVTALTLTFNSATNLAIYAGKFTSDSSTATTITLPSGYTAASSNPTIETGESYEFSVMDNVFLMVKL